MGTNTIPDQVSTVERKITLIFGTSFWLAAGVALIYLFALPKSDDSASVAASLARYTLPTASHAVIETSQPTKVGDPIFHCEADGNWIQVGHVDRILSEQKARLTWYSSGSPAEYDFAAHRNRGTLAEAVRTMLPKDRRDAISERLTDASRAYGPELSDAFRPIIEKSLRDSVPVIERGLTSAVTKYRPQLEQLGKRYEKEIVNERIVPLARDEILPVVRTHGEPLANEIGQELWQRASLFRFGWRLAYDKLPLPERNLTKQEWDRFVETEAIPVFESRVDEVVDAVKMIMVELSENEAIRVELRQVMDEVLSDGELRSLIGSILREGVGENQELRNVWIENWQTDQARAAIQLAGDRFEPIVREIGDEIFGTREEGISPGFAKVLRNQILGKDRRWLVATPRPEPRASGTPIVVTSASESQSYPLLFLAAEAGAL